MILFLSLFTACEKDVHDHHHHHDHEMMTTVVLAFTDDAGQESSFRWSDMGGTEDVEIDDIIKSFRTAPFASKPPRQTNQRVARTGQSPPS